MAKARMLHKKISISSQVNRLSLPARLLFTWMISHADDEGKLRGEAEFIRATVVPMTRWSFVKIEGYLNEMQNQGLIYRWKKDEELIIEFIKWGYHQSIRKDRFIASLLPSFPNKKGNHVASNGLPKDNQEDTQSNISESSLIKSNKSEANEIHIADNSYKKDDDGINPYRFEANTRGEVAAFDTWKRLEPYNPRAFSTTYLFALKKGLPPDLFYQFASEIKQDSKVEKPGAVFNEKVKMYFEKIS